MPASAPPSRPRAGAVQGALAGAGLALAAAWAKLAQEVWAAHQARPELRLADGPLRFAGTVTFFLVVYAWAVVPIGAGVGAVLGPLLRSHRGRPLLAAAIGAAAAALGCVAGVGFLRLTGMQPRALEMILYGAAVGGLASAWVGRPRRGVPAPTTPPRRGAVPPRDRAYPRSGS